MVPLQAPLVHGGPWMQQGWPVLPHGVQWSAEPVVLQMVVVPVQTFPAQQGSPSVPHDSQKPEDPDETHTLLPAPSEEHDASLATHVLVLAWLSQHPPALHCWPGQHGSLFPPQGLVRCLIWIVSG